MEWGFLRNGTAAGTAGMMQVVAACDGTLLTGPVRTWRSARGLQQRTHVVGSRRGVRRDCSAVQVFRTKIEVQRRAHVLLVFFRNFISS
eukprot:4547672-Alexandrium_andersonii.AAC.1